MLESPVSYPALEVVDPSQPDPLQFGTLVHALLERVPLAGQTNVQELCDFLAPQYLTMNSPANCAGATALVERFLESDRVEQITQARCVERELEFILPWPVPGEEGGGRYLHGYIDCLYQDAQGEWHLLDYKSNQVTAEGVPTAAQSYEMQMYVYALACERALGKRPVESVVHFLRPACEYAFHWAPEREKELNQELNRAIASLLTPPNVH